MLNRRTIAASLMIGLAGLSALPAVAQDKIRFAVTDVDGLNLSSASLVRSRRRSRRLPSCASISFRFPVARLPWRP